VTLNKVNVAGIMKQRPNSRTHFAPKSGEVKLTRFFRFLMALLAMIGPLAGTPKVPLPRSEGSLASNSSAANRHSPFPMANGLMGLRWAGGILTVSAMSAAILSHLTWLGFSVQGDHGLLFGMAVVTFSRKPK
jgi:hypothetical protein